MTSGKVSVVPQFHLMSTAITQTGLLEFLLAVGM